MQVTEQQAGTLWCPMSRVGIVAGEHAVAVNRHGNPGAIEEESRCLGSACMFWRWVGLKADPAHAAAVAKLMREGNVAHPKAAKMVADDPEKYGLPGKPTHGYCGIAGKPEFA